MIGMLICLFSCQQPEPRLTYNAVLTFTGNQSTAGKKVNIYVSSGFFLPTHSLSNVGVNVPIRYRNTIFPPPLQQLKTDGGGRITAHDLNPGRYVYLYNAEVDDPAFDFSELRYGVFELNGRDDLVRLISLENW